MENELEQSKNEREKIVMRDKDYDPVLDSGVFKPVTVTQHWKSQHSLCNIMKYSYLNHKISV